MTTSIRSCAKLARTSSSTVTPALRTGCWRLPRSSGARKSRPRRAISPGEIALLGLLFLAPELLGKRQQPVRSAGVTVEDDVLASLAQLRIDVVIDDHLAGIDDAHVHAGMNRVIQEHRMHRLAHRLVAAEREGQIGDAAGDVRARQVRPNPARRLYEVDAVIVVLLDSRRDREDVGI